MSSIGVTLCRNKVHGNIENLISNLSSQLTSRQKMALREIKDIVNNWGIGIMTGIHEFRFKGAGCYRGYVTERGFKACQTIPEPDYIEYIKLFTNGETGKFIIKRYVSLPNV